jgi:hypothetical protein
LFLPFLLLNSLSLSLSLSRSQEARQERSSLENPQIQTKKSVAEPARLISMYIQTKKKGSSTTACMVMSTLAKKPTVSQYSAETKIFD